MAEREFGAEDFPETVYLQAFRDVRIAVEAGYFRSGYEHFTIYGQREIAAGVRPSPFSEGQAPRSVLPPTPTTPVPALPPALRQLASDASIPYTPPQLAEIAPATPSFDEALYLALNPDVAALVAAGVWPSGAAHFLAAGRLEEDAGLRPTLGLDANFTAPPPTHKLPDLAAFDADTYLMLYPDVRRAVGGDADAARRHWIEHGAAEGRQAPGVALFAGWRARSDAVMAKPFGINLFGPFGASSGLGTAARGLLRALRSVGIPIDLRCFDVTRGPPRVLAAESERPARYRINLFLANADQVTRLTHLYPPGFFDDAYNIAVWAWELAAFRPDWYASFAPLDEVWTNSDFEMLAIGAVAPLPVHKIRLPVEVTHEPPGPARELFGIPPDRLVFLVAFDVGSTSARKNPLLVVQAFREAFAAGENVFLVVKFHSNAVEPEITRHLTRALRGMANALVVADRLSDADMARLQAACDVLVSAHRSEGFGLNIAEFMALGKPVIATNYSGNLEFLDEGVGYPIDYQLVEIETASGPYDPGYIWADPDRASLVGRLRQVYENQTEAWARGARAAARMRGEFSVAQIGQAIRKRLIEIGMMAEHPPFLQWYGGTRGLAGPAPLAALAPPDRAALAALGMHRPVLSVIVPVYNVRADFLAACVASVRAQTYPYWELCLCDDASTDPATLDGLHRLQGADPRIRIRHLPGNRGISAASNAAVEMATGEFLLLLDNDDRIEPDALLEVARAAIADPDIDVMYTDEDKIDEFDQLIETYFKPDWSPEHLESVMYVLHMLVVRKKLFLELGGFRDEYGGAQDYDLMLRLARRTQQIHHIARPLYHWRALPGSAAAQVDAKPYALEAGMRALSDHARVRYGDEASVQPGLLPGTFRVRRPILGEPPVTLIILTNNGSIDLPGRGRFAMIDNLVDSILRNTAYRNYEILVVDNGRLAAGQISRLRALNVRVENYPGRAVPFNYAAKANFAIRLCRTEHLVMLNDDMEVIDEDWLTSLLEFSADPEIGAVGGRLLHADGTVQHVGCVIGIHGATAHVYHSYPGDFVGYNGFTHLIRNYAAVTGACLATRKSVLSQVGGFDESFAIDFNDTDLCLKMLEGGYRVVYTPYCQLFHFEGASAPRDAQDAEERRRFTARWARYVANDPYYNPNLSRDRFDYS